MNAREDIAFLVGSASRVEILRALIESPSTPTSLADRCSCARETAQRTLSGFADRGWVTKTDGQYELTAGGTSVLEQYERLSTVVVGADQLQQFLRNVGPAADTFSVESIVGGEQVTVTNATADNPHAPIDRYLTFLGADPVDSFRGVTPIVSRVYNEAAERILGPNTSMELVIDESVLAVSETEYPDALQRAWDLDQFTLYVSPNSVDVGVALVDGRGFVGAYDQQGNLVASVDGSGDQFLTWANTVYDEYRQSATRLDPTAV